MTLLSFRIATIMKKTPAVSGEAEAEMGAPTPYQLSLLVELFSGSVIALWNWTKYLQWPQREQCVLIVYLAVTFLSSLPTFLGRCSASPVAQYSACTEVCLTS
jgi:hypothetical protein